MLRAGQILYTYLHLAPDPEQTRALIDSKAVCIAYETITGPGGGLPLLAPMSEVAGRMSIQAGAAHLEKSKGGMALLLGGVPGVTPGTPPSSNAIPPFDFSRCAAPAWIDMRPATSLIGASNGKPPPGPVIVS